MFLFQNASNFKFLVLDFLQTLLYIRCGCRKKYEILHSVLLE